MSTVNLLLSVDNKLALKLPTVKKQVDNFGNETLTVGGNVRGEIMFLIGSWLAFNGDGQHMGGQCNGGAITNGHGNLIQNDEQEEEDYIILFAVKQGIPVLIELIEATVKLELWPIFEPACKMMAELIKDKDVAGVIEFLKLDGDVKLSTPCIEGFLKYLPIFKRLELDAIGLEEWQQASHGVWSQQKVLFFGHRDDTVRTKCKHTVDLSVPKELNTLNCTESELQDNLESVRASRRRIVPDRFLKIIAKCTNLESIAWDTKFGQMADTKLARVLEQYCSHLEHIKGSIRKEFEFELNGKTCLISPASFVDVYEPKNLLCYNVIVEGDDQDSVLVTKLINDINVQEEQIPEETNRPEPTQQSTMVTLAETVADYMSKPFVLHENWYILASSWCNKMRNYPQTMVEPGPIDNRSLLAVREGQYRLKDSLKVNKDFQLVHENGWKLLVDTFGLVNVNQAISRPVVYLADRYDVLIGDIQLNMGYFNDDSASFTQRRLRRYISYDDLMMVMKQMYSIHWEAPARLWLNYELLDNSYKVKHVGGNGQVNYTPKVLKDNDIVEIEADS